MALAVLAIQATACAPEVARRHVRFQSGAVTLAGTVTMPAGDSLHPGVVVVHGSGPDGRSNPYYEHLVNTFARRGIATLVYDKRGTGESGGDWQLSPFDALIDDASAAVRTIRGVAGVDPTRVGIWGGSEGAVIAPLVAAHDSLVAFLILQSITGGTFAEQNLHQTTRQVDAMQLAAASRDSAMALHGARQHFARSGAGWDEYLAAAAGARRRPWEGLSIGRSPTDWWWAWYRTKMDREPLTALRRLGIPVLAIWGEEDALIDVPRSADSVRAAVNAARNSRAELVILPRANHSLFGHGLRDAWTTRFRNRPVHLDLMGDWLARVTDR